MAQQLEQLNKEIAGLAADVRAIEKDWISTTDPQQKADLKEAWQQMVQTEKLLMGDRRALEAKLSSPAECTLLHHGEWHQLLYI